MDIEKALQELTNTIKKVSFSPKLDSEILIMKVLKISRSYLYTHKNKKLSSQEEKILMKLCKRRMKKEPVAYITGKKEFWSREFIVTTDTLIPRPESELLVEEALKLIQGNPSMRILELGTGCGAIAISLALEKKRTSIMATDISQKALDQAIKNVHQYNVKNIQFIKSNWFEKIKEKEFDLIVCNPPYIKEGDPALKELKFEPQSALISGSDGLEAIRHISANAKEYLLHNGVLMLEHGNTQEKKVAEILAARKWKNITCVKDLRRFPRVTVAK
ncbi:MAG: peptide chain release factor N(5)-glutamine methyltransferase [Pseudomonadota bacterium]|nr:peptide chain release factor N(5)-glutamine methyltransferase [Pseudomonadota bacterium]